MESKRFRWPGAYPAEIRMAKAKHEAHLVIDHEKCLNSGQCAYLQPELFKLDESGAPVVIVDHPSGDLMDRARDAIEMCPAQAISLDEGG